MFPWQRLPINDLYIAKPSGIFSICVFLDLSTAFETIDRFLHEILSPLTSTHHFLWFSSFSKAFPPQSIWRLLCSVHSLKSGGLGYHLWAGTSHFHIYSPVHSPALLSSTSDYFLDTLLGVPQTHQTQVVYNGADHLLVPNTCSSSCASSSVASTHDTQDKLMTLRLESSLTPHTWVDHHILATAPLKYLFTVPPFLCTDQGGPDSALHLLSLIHLCFQSCLSFLFF